MARLPKALRENVRLLDVHTHVGISPQLFLTHAFPNCQGLRDAYEQNRRAGISHAVVFPMCETFWYDQAALQKGRVKPGGGVGKAPYAFENEQLLRQVYRIFPDYRRMFIPFAMVDTLRETKKQVAVLEKLIADFPFYGLKIHPRATAAAISTLGREGRPLLEFARAHDLPFIIHAAFPKSIDPLSRVGQLFDLARAHPKLRFCAAHFGGFNRSVLEEASMLDNVWVDSAAMVIGCECVRRGFNVYDAGPGKVPSDYKDPPAVFAELSRRYPDTFVWGSDNPFHTWICESRLITGKVVKLRLWSSLEQEVALLRDVKGALRRKVAVENALRFIQG